MKYYKVNRKELIDFLNSKTTKHFKCKESDKIEIKLDGNDYSQGVITVKIDV